MSADFIPGAKLDRLAATIANPRPVLDAIGAMMASRAKASFGAQRRGQYVWPERAVPNIPGILADLRESRTPPARRFDPRPAGVDKGRLLADISHQCVGRDAVEVGSALPYAGIIQNGGEVDIPVTPSMKDALKRYLDSLDAKAEKSLKKASGVGPSSGDFKGYAKSLGTATLARKSMGYLLARKVTSITWKVSARPFVGFDTDDLKDARRIIARDFFRPSGKAPK